ncbi:MAG: PD40 domain-containing protein [bacterium]|nr:MAG: PD40 domain-containing protein [bacterium]
MRKVVVLIAVALAQIAFAFDAGAVITRRAIYYDDGTPVYVIDEPQVALLSYDAWERVYNLFDRPVSMCMVVRGNTDNFFVLDKNMGIVRIFGTIEYPTTPRYVSYFFSHGGGFGTGINRYNFPEAITIDPGNTGYYYDTYILDSGNNRIQKLVTDLYNNTMTHSGYIFDVNNHDGYGPLNGAQDIDFCRLPGASHDFLVVADTYNHRILAIDPDGNVLYEVGGSGPGNGQNEFNLPIAATATKINYETAEAFVYVADRGNNRIVKIYQDSNWNPYWVKSMDFPQGDEDLLTGFEDIEVDDTLYYGVFVLDSRNSEVLHLDFDLERVMQRYDNFYYEGGPLYSLTLSQGELGVVCPFTYETGLETFEIRSSINELSASPNPFKPPMEWTMITSVVTGSGYMDAVVKDMQNNLVKTLRDSFFVYPCVDYFIWDGKDDQEQYVSEGMYKIVCSVYDRHWMYTDTEEINVEVVADDNLKILATHDEITGPKWSPDGTELVYSARDGSQKRVIKKVDYSSLTETSLTDTQKDDFYPAWSPLGDSLVYTRRLVWWGLWGHEEAIYIMDAAGQGDRLINDTTETIRKLWNIDPKWIPSDGEVTYIKHLGEGYQQIRKIDLGTGDDDLIKQTSGWMQYYSWAPSCEKITLTWGLGNGLPYKVYTYDIEGDYFTQLTSDVDSIVYDFCPEWSPDGERILFIEEAFWPTGWNWNVMTVPANGGVKIPVSGLGSSDVMIYSSLTWSPDGTKIAFAIQGESNVDLLAADYIRGTDAFPAAYFTMPLALAQVVGTVALTGRVADNISVNGEDTLSSLDHYYIEYGAGAIPEEWLDEGITLTEDCGSGDCQVFDDTLAMWNTGILDAGLYTVRLVASDGVDSNVVYCRINVTHNTWIVKKNGTGDFTTIQAAIDTAAVGDTISVYAGDYEENLLVEKAIHIIGAEDGVRVIGGNACGIILRDHDYTAEIKRISIHNDGYYEYGRGVYISDASPVFRECTIRHNGHPSSTKQGGIRIVGDSYPEFYDCVITENKSGNYGGGVALCAGEGEYPAPSFYNCQITNNYAEGYGCGVGLQYEHETPLDTTYQQPLFVNCIIRNNTSSGTGSGSAVGLTECHAPQFLSCEISSNTGNDYGVIYGSYAAARLSHCTISDNDGDDVLYFWGTSGIGSSPIKVDNCIISFNDGPAMALDDKYDVNYSCFWENDHSDTAWVNRGEGNINEDPAFCDRSNDDYELYCFSPCAPVNSEAGQIGMYGVGCISGYDSLHAADDRINVCPAGDWDSLLVVVDLDDDDMTRDIDSTEIVLMAPYGAGYKLYNWGDPIYADGPATSENNWHTTITHKYMSGCGNDSLLVLLDGELLGKVAISIRSSDYNVDEDVNLSDFCFFAETYNKCEGDSLYNECFNYILDAGTQCVHLSELVCFGDHYNKCSLPDSQPTMLSSGEVLLAETGAMFMIQDDGTGNGSVRVTVYLENVTDLSALFMAMDNESAGLEFISWEQNPEFDAKTIVETIPMRGRELLLISTFGADGMSGPVIEVGTIRMRYTKEGVPLSDEGFSLLFGDVLTMDGRIWKMQGAEVEGAEEIVVYRNRLGDNYPNPFNPNTVIEYSIARDSHVNLSIYNVNGQLVRTLKNEHQKRNKYTVSWDGKDNRGRDVSSGVYFYRLKTDEFTQSKKLILLR